MSSLRPNVSIEEVGLKKFLDDSAERHNGYGYDDFVKNQKLGKSGLAKLFGVDRDTIYRWLIVLEKEQS